MQGKLAKYSVPLFVLGVGIFGVIRVSMWAELSIDNIIFSIIALMAVFLAGVLFALYRCEDRKKER